MGQLKRKGKFDLKSPFMKKSKKKGDNDAISQPAGQPDPSKLLMGSLNTNGSIIEDINGNYQDSDENKVGEYVPTEFPIEAKLNEPKYSLDSASPSSDLQAVSTQNNDLSTYGNNNNEYENPTATTVDYQEFDLEM